MMIKKRRQIKKQTRTGKQQSAPVEVKQWMVQPRLDRVASIIHWKLRGIHRFYKTQNWFDHQTKPVLEKSDI